MSLFRQNSCLVIMQIMGHLQACSSFQNPCKCPIINIMLNRLLRSLPPDLQQFENPVIQELLELGHFCGLSEVLNELPIADLNP